jgi:adenylate kinase
VSDLSFNSSLITFSSLTKLLILDTVEIPEFWLHYFRSLHIEHVSPKILISQEICRRSPLGHSAELALRRRTPVPAETITTLMRRWFMARKPDAGFALQGFPATLLQARTLDEWLHVRDESLECVVAFSPTIVQVEIIDYYRIYGLMAQINSVSASASAHDTN